jgi:2-polyprenyl-6-methoxyphenol hydroxylase-like FAD-dependent oxidoreductase
MPALMNDFELRGGMFEYGHIGENEVEELCRRFDLVVVCTGKTALSSLFEPDPRYSVYKTPLRLLCAGLYTGVSDTEPRSVTFSVSPGHGEMIEIPMETFHGHATALLFENIPGADLAELAQYPQATDPQGFRNLVLDKLRKHHTSTYERVRESEFDLCRANDILQGAIVPTVRRGFREIANGTFAVALGDFHVTLDPVVGQGANMASHSAWVLADAIAEADVFDSAFCERVDAARLPRLLGTFAWTHFMLRPPSPEFLQFVGTMSQNKALCDEFTQNFNAPERQWENLRTPERILAWIERSARAASA